MTVRSVAVFGKLLVLAALVAAVFALTMPAQAQSGTGRVRIMHASPDAPAVDIYVNGAKAVTALAFPNNTGYVSLPAGSHEVKVFASPSTGTGTPVLQATLSVAAGKDYSVLAVGQLANSTLSLLPLEDNNALPAAGKAHVRFIHASPDTQPVDIGVTGTDVVLFKNVAFKGVGNYSPVAVGTYSLDAKVSASGLLALRVPGVKLDDRTVYTVVAVGTSSSQTLRVVAMVDAAPPAPPKTGTGLEAAGSTNYALAGGLAAAVLGLGLGGAVAVRSRR